MKIIHKKRNLTSSDIKESIHAYVNQHTKKDRVCDECKTKCPTFIVPIDEWTRDLTQYKELCRICKSVYLDEPISYRGMHLWLGRYWTKAKKCEKCSATGYTEWSNKTREFTALRSNWQEFCKLCHIEYDKLNGHYSRKT